MSSRRWRRWTLAAVVLVIIAIVVWLFATPRPRLGESVYKKMSVGMSLAEIERLVGVAPQQIAGVPPKNVSDAIATSVGSKDLFDWVGEPKVTTRGEGLDWDMHMFGDARQGPARCFLWRGPNRVLFVAVDDNSVTRQLAYGKMRISPKNWLARCKFWFDSFFEDKD